MQIYGPYRVSTPQPLSPTPRNLAQKSPDSVSKTGATPVDQLDLSSNISSSNRLQPSTEIAGGGEIRIDRVADVRRQIASGNYETPEKLDAALNRLLDQLV